MTPWPDTYRVGVSCNTVARLLKVEHCESCHTDMYDGFDADEISTRKGCIEVCCIVGTAWSEAHAVTRTEP